MISAQVTNNNYASVARYNAHTEVAARASTRPFGAIPGLASLNVCGDLRVCNYQNLTTEHFLARQLSIPVAEAEDTMVQVAAALVIHLLYHHLKVLTVEINPTSCQAATNASKILMHGRVSRRHT